MNRSFGGPIQNEFVGLLHNHSSEFGCEFVDNEEWCDIIFTNDVYPSNLIYSSKPKIKRMDGVFWQENFKERNEKYNRAALESDVVIFISEYSKDSFEQLYHKHHPNSFVITHWVEKVFEYTSTKNFNGVFFCMATDWKRPEKRLNEVIKFANLFAEYTIHLVGTCDSELPKNIIRHGYLDTSSILFENIIKDSSTFLNLTCKDAATKTVCTSINYHLPVLYSKSGGVSELVKDCGYGISEKDSIEFLDHIPELNDSSIKEGCSHFINNYGEYKRNIQNRNPENLLKTSCKQYFEIFKQVERVYHGSL